MSLQLCNIYVDFRERTLTSTKLRKCYVTEQPKNDGTLQRNCCGFVTLMT